MELAGIILYVCFGDNKIGSLHYSDCAVCCITLFSILSLSGLDFYVKMLRFARHWFTFDICFFVLYFLFTFSS